MFKQIIRFGIFFTLISCGQNAPHSVVKEANDSAVASTKANHEIQPVKPGDTSDGKVKHEAYNEDIQNLPGSLDQFVPPGYTALDTTSGDLNTDPYTDMILVLKKNGEDTTSDVVAHPEKRPLLILLGQADHSYKLAARNDNVVYCIDCGGVMGDPFMDVVINKGYFSVEHYGGSGWRWTRTITFKYSSADNYWYLHKDGGDSFHATEPEKRTTKIRTVKDFGKVGFEKFDVYNEE